MNLSACERLDYLGVTTISSLIQRMKVFDGSGSGKLSFDCGEANIDFLAKVFSFNDLSFCSLMSLSSGLGEFSRIEIFSLNSFISILFLFLLIVSF